MKRQDNNEFKLSCIILLSIYPSVLKDHIDLNEWNVKRKVGSQLPTRLYLCLFVYINSEDAEKKFWSLKVRGSIKNFRCEMIRCKKSLGEIIMSLESPSIDISYRDESDMRRIQLNMKKVWKSLKAYPIPNPHLTSIISYRTASLLLWSSTSWILYRIVIVVVSFVKTQNHIFAYLLLLLLV